MKRRTRLLVLALVAALFAVPVLPANAEDPLTLSQSKTVYTAYLDTMHFTVVTHASNLNYRLDVQYPGNSQWYFLQGAEGVNDDIFYASLAATYNVKVRAQLIDGKGTDEPADDTVAFEVTHSVAVRAYLSTNAGGYHTTSGSYAVYPRGRSPQFNSASYPAAPGKRCLRHVVQRHYSSGWRTVKTSACLVEQKQGKVSWTWAGRHASGVRFRVRATFAGDVANRPGVAAWRYFRFR